MGSCSLACAMVAERVDYQARNRSERRPGVDPGKRMKRLGYTRVVFCSGRRGTNEQVADSIEKTETSLSVRSSPLVGPEVCNRTLTFVKAPARGSCVFNVLRRCGNSVSIARCVTLRAMQCIYIVLVYDHLLRYLRIQRTDQLPCDPLPFLIVSARA